MILQQQTMKHLYSLLTFFLLTFAIAAPTPLSVGERDIQGIDKDVEAFLNMLADNMDMSLLSKRDNLLLTTTFTQLNKSGVGVKLAHGFATNPLTQPQLINLIENYITATGLTKILTAVDQSDLAVDIVMSFFENDNMVPGLITIIKTLINQKVISIPFISKRDLTKRGVFDFIDGIANDIGQKLGFGQTSSSQATGQTTSQTQPVTSSTTGQTSSSTTAIAASSTPEEEIQLPTISILQPQVTSSTKVISRTTGQTQSTSIAEDSLSSDALSASKSAQNDAQTSSSSTTSTSSGPVLGFFESVQNSIEGINNQILQTVITLVNDVSNLEQICESLQKSGLAVSILEDFITTTDGQQFLIKLVTAIVNDKVITLDDLISAVNDSDIVTNTVTKIMANSSLRSIAINYILNNFKTIIGLLF
ncbi:uncharacterized protein J8A68_004834 [[Candida] subhashii]|uniref:Opaque-phase-specific protein OP4 n=1 Tax=[Candida] subhashii TaxID=561895 RepID=A0A8J5UK54_9ASCO|nr:uncharacterized protein J8A68_004834 [[Candida] subhashii]KAG7661681.1 hypothetical protein J8A68_004834 [[Candida] subhashii]